MPLYEYQCASCGERTEVIQKINDPAPEQCAKCGGAMKKLISSPAIQFKGSGFYKTDYASSSSTPSSSSGSSASSEKPAESKPAESSTKTESTKSESKSE